MEGLGDIVGKSVLGSALDAMRKAYEDFVRYAHDLDGRVGQLRCTGTASCVRAQSTGRRSDWISVCVWFPIQADRLACLGCADRGTDVRSFRVSLPMRGVLKASERILISELIAVQPFCLLQLKLRARR